MSDLKNIVHFSIITSKIIMLIVSDIHNYD